MEFQTQLYSLDQQINASYNFLSDQQGKLLRDVLDSDKIKKLKNIGIELESLTHISKQNNLKPVNVYSDLSQNFEKFFDQLSEDYATNPYLPEPRVLERNVKPLKEIAKTITEIYKQVLELTTTQLVDSALPQPEDKVPYCEVQHLISLAHAFKTNYPKTKQALFDLIEHIQAGIYGPTFNDQLLLVQKALSISTLIKMICMDQCLFKKNLNDLDCFFEEEEISSFKKSVLMKQLVENIQGFTEAEKAMDILSKSNLTKKEHLALTQLNSLSLFICLSAQDVFGLKKLLQIKISLKHLKSSYKSTYKAILCMWCGYWKEARKYINKISNETIRLENLVDFVEEILSQEKLPAQIKLDKLLNEIAAAVHQSISGLLYLAEKFPSFAPLLISKINTENKSLEELAVLQGTKKENPVRGFYIFNHCSPTSSKEDLFDAFLKYSESLKEEDKQISYLILLLKASILFLDNLSSEKLLDLILEKMQKAQKKEEDYPALNILIELIIRQKIGLSIICLNKLQRFPTLKDQALREMIKFSFPSLLTKTLVANFSNEDICSYSILKIIFECPSHQIKKIFQLISFVPEKSQRLLLESVAKGHDWKVNDFSRIVDNLSCVPEPLLRFKVWDLCLKSLIPRKMEWGEKMLEKAIGDYEKLWLLLKLIEQIVPQNLNTVLSGTVNKKVKFLLTATKLFVDKKEDETQIITAVKYYKMIILKLSTATNTLKKEVQYEILANLLTWCLDQTMAFNESLFTSFIQTIKNSELKATVAGFFADELLNKDGDLIDSLAKKIALLDVDYSLFFRSFDTQSNQLLFAVALLKQKKVYSQKNMNALAHVFEQIPRKEQYITFEPFISSLVQVANDNLKQLIHYLNEETRKTFSLFMDQLI